MTAPRAFDDIRASQEYRHHRRDLVRRFFRIKPRVIERTALDTAALLAVRVQRVAFDPNIGRPEIPIMGDFACWPCQSALAKKGRPGGRPLIEWLDSAICSIRSASPIRGRICECTKTSSNAVEFAVKLTATSICRTI